MIVEKASTTSKKEPALIEETETVGLELEHKKEEAKVAQQPPAKTASCKHYFGYLSKRSKSDGLPEECMVCPNIVQCMLKSVTE